MYQYGDVFALSCTSTDILGHLPESTIATPMIFPSAAQSPTLSIVPVTLSGNEFDSVNESVASLKSQVGYSRNCGSYGSPSSLPSCYFQRPCFFQRSMSSHSLQKDRFHHHFFSSEFLDLETGPMRKVLSTGDLPTSNSLQQYGRRSESPLLHENHTIEGMNRVGRYSAEERRERIERYRSKRNQRNFNKKIKYVCRKTLADSRPRIRGRFARNDEIGESSQTQWNQMGGDEDEEDEDVWINFLNSFNVNANLIP